MSESEVTKLSCEALRAKIDETVQLFSNACWDHDADGIDYQGKLLPVLLDEAFRRIHPGAQS